MTYIYICIYMYIQAELSTLERPVILPLKRGSKPSYCNRPAGGAGGGGKNKGIHILYIREIKIIATSFHSLTIHVSM